MKKVYFLAFALSSLVFANAQMWLPQATNFPVSAGVDEISIVNENVVWINAYDGSGAGQYLKEVAVTTNGGSSWTARTITNIPSAALISDLAGVDANTAYVVTAPTTSNTSLNGIWKTVDGGVNWTKFSGNVFNSSMSFANHIYFWDENNGYCGGDPVNGKFEMYKTSDGGATWNAITTAPAPLNDDEFTYTGVKEVLGDNIWLGTSLGRILKSTDRGNTWTVWASPATDFGGVISEGSSASFAFSDENNGLLITDDNGVVFLFATSNGGENWDDLFPVGNWYPGDIAYVPGTEKTFVSSGINATIPMGSSYSTDGGSTWIDIDFDEQRGELAFLNGTTGWCGQFSDGPGGTTGIMKFDGDLSDMAVTDVLAKTNLQAYPVPARDVLNFSAKKEILQVSLIDTTGKVVNQTKGTKVNVSSLPAGVYIAQARYADGSIENIKVAVK